jgi:hypothetical protein
MTLAEAFTTLATAGCRLVPDDAGGVALVVPDGATIPREVLEVLRVHRADIAAAHAVSPAPAGPSPSADDLREYLTGRGVGEAGIALAVHAAEVFNVPGQGIVHELADDGLADEGEPVFFEDGIPIKTTIETMWHETGVGYVTLPAGFPGLAIPQVWAIADAHARQGVENTIATAKKQKKPLHIAVWLAGRERALEMTAITFDGATAPPGADLKPWRSRRPIAGAA